MKPWIQVTIATTILALVLMLVFLIPNNRQVRTPQGRIVLKSGQEFTCFDAWGEPVLGYAMCDDLKIPWEEIRYIKTAGRQ